MNSRKKVGLDEWKAECDIETFLQIVKHNEIELYDLRIYDDVEVFYTNIWQRHIVARSFQHIERIATTGMLGYLFRSMRRPSRVISVAMACLLWYGLSHVIFEVDIKGEQKESRKLISETLKDMGYDTPFYEKDMQQMKAQLKKKLENDIAWLEVAKQGSRYIITYTPKEFATLTKLGHNELIAQEDGVIAYFDISHGVKMHKVNDYVHAGDVLVSNVLEDSKSKKQEVYVKGKVYAYTWRDVTVSMDNNKLPKSFQYFDLLLEARGEVSKDFREGDKIYKENILQFSHDMGKIKMVIHYTLYKDITTP